MITSESPVSRRTPFGTSRGVNEPARSRGTSNRTGPISVSTVFAELPFRELPDPAPAGSPFSYPKWPVSSACNPRSNTAATMPEINPPGPVNRTPSSPTEAINRSNNSSLKNARPNASPSGSAADRSARAAAPAATSVLIIWDMTLLLPRTGTTPVTSGPQVTPLHKPSDRLGPVLPD